MGGQSQICIGHEGYTGGGGGLDQKELWHCTKVGYSLLGTLLSYAIKRFPLLFSYSLKLVQQRLYPTYHIGDIQCNML